MSKLTKTQRRKKKLKTRYINEEQQFRQKFQAERRSAHRRMIQAYGIDYYRKRFGTRILSEKDQQKVLIKE
jgi:hypothetical protein